MVVTNGEGLKGAAWASGDSTYYNVTTYYTATVKVWPLKCVIEQKHRTVRCCRFVLQQSCWPDFDVSFLSSFLPQLPALTAAATSTTLKEARLSSPTSLRACSALSPQHHYHAVTFNRFNFSFIFLPPPFISPRFSLLRHAAPPGPCGVPALGSAHLARTSVSLCFVAAADVHRETVQQHWQLNNESAVLTQQPPARPISS